MSYILDALKKDEVEPTPAVAAAPGYALPPSAPRRWWPWAAAAALLINLGVAAWLLLGSDGAQQTPTVVASNPQAKRELAIRPPANERTRQRANPPPAAAATTPAPENAMPRRTPVRERSAPSRPARVETAQSSRPTRQPAPSNATSNAQTTPRTLASGGRVLSPEQAAQLGIGDELMNSPTTVAPSTPTSTATQPAAQPAPAAANAGVNAAVKATQAITVDQLPATARSKFPALEFSSHIFADDPSMRAVVVNDQRLTEGQQLGELILRSVTEDGVIFGFRSHLVAVSVVDLWAD